MLKGRFRIATARGFAIEKFMRIPLALILAAAAVLPAAAQVGQSVPLDQLRPDESSPFFTDQQMAKYYQSADGQEALQSRMVAKYPSTGGNDSAPVQLKRFFTDMFGNVRFGPSTGRTMSSLKVEPKSFKLADRREIDVIFRIENTRNKLIKFDFPTEQRIDIVVKDSAGAVIEQWSANQTFAPEEGVLMINPNERVEYAESIPTQKMKAGETYWIEATLMNNPEFTQTTQITPR